MGKAQTGEPSTEVLATVPEWNLPTAPWTFVVDPAGLVADKLDAITAAEEIDQGSQRLLS